MQQSVQGTSTSSITDRWNEACSSTQGDVLSIKKEMTDMDIGPTEFQHMDIYYTIKEKKSAAAEVNTAVDECSKPKLYKEIKTESVQDNLRGTDEHQLIPATSTSAVLSRTTAAADDLNQSQLLHIKEIKEDEDLDLGPAVLQHMDSRYRSNQIDLNSIKQENTIVNFKSEDVLPIEFEDDQVLCSQVKNEVTESSSKGNIHQAECFKCAECSKEFKNKKYLRCHISKVHKNKSIHQCDICKRMFKTKYNVKCHILIVHRDLFPGDIHQAECFKCAECSKEFKDKKCLRSHISKVHKNKNIHQCYICKKRFKTKPNVKYHIFTVHNELFTGFIHRCDKCSKTYTYESSLWRHRRTHHSTDSSKCPECNKEFACKDYLVGHVRRMHNEDVLKDILKCK